MCIFGDYLKLFDSLFESFIVWNFFLFETFCGNILHLNETF